MFEIRDAKLGQAWLCLCLALMLHVTDEALTGFLSVYNPTVLALRNRFPWLPMPTFAFSRWLSGLVAASLLLLLLTPSMYAGALWMRPIGYIFAAIMIANALGHTVGAIAGRTFASIPVKRPMPGFYSSPVLLAAALYLLYRLIHSRPAG